MRSCACAFHGLVAVTLALRPESDPVRVGTVAELRAALAAAKPGTTIVVAAGDYPGFAAHAVAGTAARPVVVRAESAEAAPPRFSGGIHLSDCAHLVVDGLHVVGAPGNGINVDDGGTFATPAHHVVLRNLVVRDCGGRGNDDGIKLSGVVDSRVEACVVERWGRGGSALDMVGCRGIVVDGCTFRDRAEDRAASGVQVKGGSRDVVVRRCRFDDAGQRAVNLGGSTGLAFFRPAPAGFEAKDVVVEGCTFTGSDAAVAFVGVDGATVQWNTIHLPRRSVLRILQETRAEGFVPCRGGVFRDNLIVFRGDGPVCNVGPGTAPETFTFARNYWYRADAPQRSLPRLPVPERDATGGADPEFEDADAGDLTPRAGSPARGFGAGAWPGGAGPVRRGG